MINVDHADAAEQPQGVLGEVRSDETSADTGEAVQLVKDDGGRKFVQTGDESNMPLWGGLFSVSLGSLGFMTVRKKELF